MPQPPLLSWHGPPALRCGLAGEHADLKCPRPLQQWHRWSTYPARVWTGVVHVAITQVALAVARFSCSVTPPLPMESGSCPLRRVSEELQVQLGGHGSGPNCSGPYGVVFCQISKVERFVHKHVHPMKALVQRLRCFRSATLGSPCLTNGHQRKPRGFPLACRARAPMQWPSYRPPPSSLTRAENI